MKKTKFKVGDIVRRKVDPEVLGCGRVIAVYNEERGFPLRVQWFSGVIGWYGPESIEFAENPIERMKRLYSEEK